MLVGRKNCRKIVQFLVEPLMKKQKIHFTSSEWIFLCLDQMETLWSLFAYQIPLASD